MKSSSSDVPHTTPAKAEKRARRSFAEAASELGRALVGGPRANNGQAHDGRVAANRSAAASIHRLRDVLERDRAITAAIGFDDEEPPAVPSRAQQEHAATHRAHLDEQAKVCEQCGAGEDATGPTRGAVGTRPPATGLAASEPTLARTPSTGLPRRERDPTLPVSKQKGHASGRVPPAPPRASHRDLVADERDDDELSVHDEPTKVGPPPKHVEPRDERASALAAAAASAFGSTPV